MYYFIGIKEPGMLQLAEFFKELGYCVGCESAELCDEKKNFFDCCELEEEAKVVYHYNVPKDNAQLLKARKMQLKVFSFEEVINFLITKHQTVLVLEQPSYFLSHLLTETLDQLIGCNCLIENFKSCAEKQKHYFVLNVTMTDYGDKISEVLYAIITEKNKDINQIIDKYYERLNKTQKIILAYGDNLNEELNELKKPVFTYGLQKNNDIKIKNLEVSKKGYVFDIIIEDNYYGHFDLPLRDKQNLVNAMAVIAICYYERFKAKDVSRVLKKVLRKKQKEILQ